MGIFFLFILMYEILKFLNYVGCDFGEVMFFRLGISGGLGRKCIDIYIINCIKFKFILFED